LSRQDDKSIATVCHLRFKYTNVCLKCGKTSNRHKFCVHMSNLTTHRTVSVIHHLALDIKDVQD